MMRRAYQTDLSNAEWALFEPHLPAPRAPGRPRLHPLREEILNAIFYIVEERLRLATSTTRISTLAHRLPLHFRAWRLDGTWERMHSALRQRVRVRMKRRSSEPSAGVVDRASRSRRLQA
jgi:putative transposase